MGRAVAAGGPCVVLCALALGYGPAAKAIALASALRARGVRSRFAGSGIALELARRERVFDRVSELGPHAAAAARSQLADADAVISVMDPELAALACEVGRPLHVVDSLLWMRDEIPAAFRTARRYWVQEFPGVRERLGQLERAARVVGAIVGPVPARAAGPAGLVVNLGGAGAAEVGANAGPEYAELVMRALLRSGAMAAGRGPVTLLAGEACVSALRMRFPGAALRLASLSRSEALAAFAGAERVLTSPGLTASLEGFALGVPVLYLPPQNYSQWWILETLRRAGLAPSSLAWSDLVSDHGIEPDLPPQVRRPRLAALLRRCAGDPKTEALLAERIAGALAADAGALAGAQARFLRGLGARGADAIAAGVASDLGLASVPPGSA
jgi:hypothetical protein